MLAVVDFLEASDPLQVLGCAANKWIEQAHFHFWVGIQCRSDIVGVTAVNVVDKHANPHVPVDRLDQLVADLTWLTRCRSVLHNSDSIGKSFMNPIPNRSQKPV